VILGNPFYCGLCYALVEQEIFLSDVSVSCYDNGTSKFKECPFIVGEDEEEGGEGISSLCLPLQEAYMNKCTIIFQNDSLHSPHICY